MSAAPTTWTPVKAYVPELLDEPVDAERSSDGRYRFGWYELDELVTATHDLDYANPDMFMPGEVFWIQWAADRTTAEVCWWADEDGQTVTKVVRYEPDADGWYDLGPDHPFCDYTD